MTRRFHQRYRALVLALGLFSACSAPADEPARLVLKAGNTMDVIILARPSRTMIRIKTDYMAQPVTMPVADIHAVRFEKLDEELQKVELLCRSYRYADAATALKTRLEPIRNLLDIRSNAQPIMLAWIRALYGSGAYAECLGVCADLVAADAAGPPARTAQLYAALCLIEQGKFAEVKAGVLPAEPQSALELYTQARLQVARREWRPARETAARLVALHAADDEWMPPGLYLSALLYHRFREPEVSLEIAGDLSTLYPGHPLAARGAAIPADYPWPDLDDGDFESGLSRWSGVVPGRISVVAPDADGAADNGAVGEGGHVLAVRVSDGLDRPTVLSRRVNGFIPGQQYVVVFGENTRAATGGGAAAGPLLTVEIDGRPVVKTHVLRPVQGAGRFTRPYREVAGAPFVATAGVHEVRLLVAGGSAAEPRTALIDNLQVYDWNTEWEDGQ